MRWDYIRDPHEIETRSFQQIRELTDLSAFTREEQQVFMRLVHTCGEPSILDVLAYTPGAITAGMAALAATCPIISDVEMVRHGLTKRFTDETQRLCFLNDPETVALSASTGDTRSMAAVERWLPHLGGAVVVIGNAPTALYRLLELIDEGAPMPALIVGMPVGFIGAQESKQALYDYCVERGDLECITLLDRRGGSALAASAVNGLLRLNREIHF